MVERMGIPAVPILTKRNAAFGKAIFAIAGIPGSGKTTLAQGLSDRLGWPVITTGDIARAVDPAAMETGDLAEEDAFRRAFEAKLAEYAGFRVIIDGMPRSRLQLDYLPAERSQIVLLTCRPDVARDRLRRRGREDDTEELIAKRMREQTELLGLAQGAESWAYKAAGWGSSVNTTYKTPEQVIRGVEAFIAGTQREAF